MKLGVMKSQLPESLRAADLVFAYGAVSGKDALGWDLQEAIAPLGEKAKSFHDLSRLVEFVSAAAKAGELLPPKTTKHVFSVDGIDLPLIYFSQHFLLKNC